jgi:hypothetical protein
MLDVEDQEVHASVEEVIEMRWKLGCFVMERVFLVL